MVWGGMACHWRFARASNRAMLQIVGRKYCHGVGGLKYKGGEHLPVSDDNERQWPTELLSSSTR